MQAIQTKYIPATNFKSSRLKAWCERGSLTIPFPHDSRDDQHAHEIAARELCEKFVREDKAKYGDESKSGWNRYFVTGGLPSGGYAHVFTS